MLPEAVLFDMDGLLVDTETCDYQAWKELHDEHGLELTLPEYCYNAGMYGSWDRMYENIGRVTGIAPAELHARRGPRFEELVRERLAPSPELLQLLSDLKSNRIRCGIASSSDTEWVSYLVDGLGLRAEFETITTGPEVAHRKPAPDLYLLAAERLGVNPARCVALEDSAHGLQAARAAGMYAIAIPNSVSRHQDLSMASAEVAHFGKVTLDFLRDLCSGAN